MASSFADSYDQLVDDMRSASTLVFDDNYDPRRLPSQRFDSFSNSADSELTGDSAVDDSPVFPSQPIRETLSPPTIYTSGCGLVSDQTEFSSFSPKASGEPFEGGYSTSNGPNLPSPLDMQPEEGFALGEWRRQTAARLAEKEKKQKDLLSQIIDEADIYKDEFHRRRVITYGTNKNINREREKVFLEGHEKFYAEADKNYWEAIAELIPNEGPAIDNRGKEVDKEERPSIMVIQGPKPGKPTELSRMRQIFVKLKHETPIHLKPSSSPQESNPSTTMLKPVML